MHLFKLAAVAGVATVSTAFAAEAPAVQADRLIAQVKQATGGGAWDRLQTLVEQGKLAGPGLDGTYDNLTDLRHVLYVQKVALGPSTSAQGWDGKAAWSTDAAGQVRIEQSQEAIAAGIEQAYRGAYAFFWPARWPASRLYVGERQLDGATYDIVKVTPKDAEPFELWIDRGTHRIAREADITGAQPHTQIMTDYRPVDGVMLPFTTRDTIGDAKFDVVATTGTLKIAARLPAKAFGPPPPPKEPDPFPPGQTQVSIPITLNNNHIYFDVSINGQPPAPFIFDTGAVAILDPAHAAAMGIKAEGTLPGSGFGEGTAAIGMARVRSLDLGGFKLADQVFYTIDLSDGLKFEDTASTGLLGYEIPKRAVMTIDYAKAMVTLTKPAAFKPPAGAVAVPFTFHDHNPMVKASIDGIVGEFEIDTGNGGGLDLFGPFVEAHHLIQRYHATRSATTGYGAGGPITSLLARAGALRIGSLVIKQPVALIQGGNRGAGAATRTAGNIGGGLLRRFTVTLDYGHQMIYLQPNGSFAAPDLFDRSGLRLMRAPDGAILVNGVTTGGGGEAAGLEPGDRILAVDGAQSAGIKLTDLRDKLKGTPGTKVVLSVVHDGAAPQDVTLTLSDLI